MLHLDPEASLKVRQFQRSSGISKFEEGVMNQNVMRTGVLQFVVILMLCAWAPAMQGVATLRGQITDQLGGVIVGASVTLIAADGKELNTETDDRGMYRFVGLRPGTYGLQAVSRGFAGYRRSGVVLTG